MYEHIYVFMLSVFFFLLYLLMLLSFFHVFSLVKLSFIWHTSMANVKLEDGKNKQNT